MYLFLTIHVYQLFKKIFSNDDSIEIMSFIEDAKYNRESISTERKLRVCDIFTKVFSYTETNTIVNYILSVNIKNDNILTV